LSQEEKQVQWVIREAPEGWRDLVSEGMPGILGQLLAQRGVHYDEVERFLRPRLAELTDPFRDSGDQSCC
jgi:hypothetical protein